MLGAAPLLLGIFGGAVLKQGVGAMLDGEDVAVAHQLDRELERLEGESSSLGSSLVLQFALFLSLPLA